MTIDSARVELLIQAGETLTTEFKSDARLPLPDREIYENIICLANNCGGAKRP